MLNAPPAPPPSPVQSPPRRPASAALVLLLLTILFGSASEIFLKMGAVETAHLHWLPAWLGISGLASKWVWCGILLTVLSFLTYLRAVRVLPLGIAFTLSNATHVVIPLSAWIFLGEVISLRRWLGITLVLAGLYLIAKPFTRVEERL